MEEFPDTYRGRPLHGYSKTQIWSFLLTEKTAIEAERKRHAEDLRRMAPYSRETAKSRDRWRTAALWLAAILALVGGWHLGGVFFS